MPVFIDVFNKKSPRPWREVPLPFPFYCPEEGREKKKKKKTVVSDLSLRLENVHCPSEDVPGSPWAVRGLNAGMPAAFQGYTCLLVSSQLQRRAVTVWPGAGLAFSPAPEAPTLTRAAGLGWARRPRQVRSITRR